MIPELFLQVLWRPMCYVHEPKSFLLIVNNLHGFMVLIHFNSRHVPYPAFIIVYQYLYQHIQCCVQPHHASRAPLRRALPGCTVIGKSHLFEQLIQKES
jgi:hypothetical protein